MANQSTGTPSSRRWISGMVISGIGLITGSAHVDHLLEDTHTMPVVSSILFPLCLSVGLLYAGFWLRKSDYGEKQVVSIAIWSVVGAVVLTLSGTVIVAADILLHQHAVPVADGGRAVIILPSSVTEGTAIGFTYGLYSAWSDRQAAKTE